MGISQSWGILWFLRECWNQQLISFYKFPTTLLSEQRCIMKRLLPSGSRLLPTGTGFPAPVGLLSSKLSKSCSSLLRPAANMPWNPASPSVVAFLRWSATALAPSITCSPLEWMSPAPAVTASPLLRSICSAWCGPPLHCPCSSLLFKSVCAAVVFSILLFDGALSETLETTTSLLSGPSVTPGRKTAI